MTDQNKSISVRRVPSLTTEDVSKLVSNSFIRINSNIICDKNSDFDQKDLIGCHIDCNCLQKQLKDLLPQESNQWSDTCCDCSSDKCGVDSNYDKNGFLINWRKPVYECGDNCFCGTTPSLLTQCRNRWTQRATECLIQLFIDPLKGYSIRTLNDLKLGQFIVEYCGEVIDKIEAKNRFKLYSERNEEHNYILIFREHFGSESSFEIIIDAKQFGNDSRFINHSCDPNLIAIPVRSDSLRPRICLFAAKDIDSGSELSYNYGSEESPLSTKSCFCGSDKCKGFMPLDITL